MKIALAQIRIAPETGVNLEKALHCMEEAASNGAKVVCFPELQFTPFFPQFPKKDASGYALSISNEFVQMIRKKCKEQGLVTVPNFYLHEGEKTYDASPVIDSDGALLGISKMVHVVRAPYFYEQDYYAPSDTGFQVYDTAAGRLGVVICFDRHYPESIRICALKGAQLIVIPTANTKAEPLETFEWEVRIPAMQNNVFIAMCNRVGKEGAMHFAGESLIVDPNGEVMAKADDTEQILYAELDLKAIDKSREERPYVKLRRPEFCRLDEARGNPTGRDH
jgi:predicted amidohydrolase